MIENSKLKFEISNEIIADLLEFKARLDKSKKPIIIAGAGAKNSYKKLRRFIQRYKIPTTTTLHGLGVMDEYNELASHIVNTHLVGDVFLINPSDL